MMTNEKPLVYARRDESRLLVSPTDDRAWFSVWRVRLGEGYAWAWGGFEKTGDESFPTALRAAHAAKAALGW